MSQEYSPDASIDASIEASIDASIGMPIDASIDASIGMPIDMSRDASRDASTDTSTDASVGTPADVRRSAGYVSVPRQKWTCSFFVRGTERDVRNEHTVSLFDIPTWVRGRGTDIRGTDDIRIFYYTINNYIIIGPNNCINQLVNYINYIN